MDENTLNGPAGTFDLIINTAAIEINDAYERVLASDVRYRFVIDAATI